MWVLSGVLYGDVVCSTASLVKRMAAEIEEKQARKKKAAAEKRAARFLRKMTTTRTRAGRAKHHGTETVSRILVRQDIEDDHSLRRVPVSTNLGADLLASFTRRNIL